MARGDYDADGSTDTIRKYSRKGLTLASELESTRASRARSESRARYNRAYGLSQGKVHTRLLRIKLKTVSKYLHKFDSKIRKQ